MSLFYVYDEKILITQTIKLYSELFYIYQDYLKETVSSFDGDAKFFLEPKYQIVNLENKMKIHVYDIKRRFEKYNIFEVSTEDFMTENSGLSKIYDVTSQYYEYVIKTTDTVDRQYNIDMKQVEKDANAMITGLDFCVVSNSIISHFVYSVQNQSKVKKQTEEASRYYKNITAQIKEKAIDRIDKSSNLYYSKVYAPQIINAIELFYSVALGMELGLLCKTLSLNLDEIKDIDYNKSNKILADIKNSLNPEALLSTAIKVCPFNINAFVLAEKEGLYDFCMEELLKELSLYDKFENIINPQPEQEDEYILNEMTRMLYEQGLDFEHDKNWKMRAKSHLNSSKQLIQKYPNCYVGYFLAAYFTLAANMNTRNTGFWDSCDQYIDNAFSIISGKKISASILTYIVSDYIDLVSRFQEKAKEYRDEFITSLGFSPMDGNESADWKGTQAYKRLLIHSVKSVIHVIDLLDEKKDIINEYTEFVSDEQLATFKNSLLWLIMTFCSPYACTYYKNNQPQPESYQNIPLSERQFALDKYEELIAAGIDKHDSGLYSMNKDSTFWPKQYVMLYSKYMHDEINPPLHNSGCYIATCIYGSYDCPEVWTLRRFRDYKLSETIWGKVFIKSYYTVSPIAVKMFGDTKIFKLFWKKILDKMVAKLKLKGYEDKPYKDIEK